MQVRLNQRGNNFHSVHIGQMAFFFSYETCIAFIDEYGECYHAANGPTGKWSNTTTKHLRQCPDATMTLKWQEFVAHMDTLEYCSPGEHVTRQRQSKVQKPS